MDSIPQVEIPDEKDQRYCVLSFEQVKRLNDLMSDHINIHGRGNFPTIEVKLCDLVSTVKARLEHDGVKVKEIRLNGSGASSVLAADFANISYNDLDLIFSVDLSTGKAYDRVKTAVLESLMELLPEGVSRKRMSSCSMKEAYVSKMVKVNDSDRWSLITLGNNRAQSVELKFVNSMRRQYEFSVDSFHILLDTLFLFYDCAEMPISDNFYPTVVGESMFGDFHEALYHLHKKLIATKNPEEIRGGGLLKYCNLLCNGYEPAWHEEVKNMERYMCSRFFIDFPDIHTQQAKLENYLYNHFHNSEDRLKYDYLMILYQVVDESTVCLMGHERRLTLSLIEELAFQIYCPDPATYYQGQQQQQHQGQHHHQQNHHQLQQHHNQQQQQQQKQQHQYQFHYGSNSMALPSSSSSTGGSSTGATTPSSEDGGILSDPNLLSPMSLASDSSMSSSSSSSSVSSGSQPSSGYTTPQKPETPGPVSTPSSLIPTYEIVTSCQPAVVYSNGYYYTSFVPPPAGQSTASVTVSCAVPPPPLPSAANTNAPSSSVVTSSSSCLSCSCSQWSVPPPNHHFQASHHQTQTS